MPKEKISLDDLVVVEAIGGAVVDMEDGQPLLYGLTFEGSRERKDSEPVPVVPRLYVLDLTDLATMMVCVALSVKKSGRLDELWAEMHRLSDKGGEALLPPRSPAPSCDGDTGHTEAGDCADRT